MTVSQCNGLMSRCVTDGSLVHPGEEKAPIPINVVNDSAILMSGGGHLIEVSSDALARWGIDNRRRPDVDRFWRNLCKAANDKGNPPPCPLSH